MIKLKRLFKEQNEKKPDINVMNIIEDVVDIERSILELKKRLKELVPKVKKSQGRTIDPDFFGDDYENHLTKSDNDKLETDKEFDRYHRRKKNGKSE